MGENAESPSHNQFQKGMDDHSTPGVVEFQPWSLVHCYSWGTPAAFAYFFDFRAIAHAKSHDIYIYHKLLSESDILPRGMATWQLFQTAWV